MNNKYARFRSAICALIVLGLVGAVPVTAAAKGYSPVVTSNGTGFKIKYASDGTPLAVPTQTSTGVNVTAPVPLPVSPGALIQATAVGAIGGAQVAGAWGAAIGALGGLAIAAIPPLVDMLQRANLRVKPDGSLEKKDSAVCTVSPCYSYTVGDYNGNQTSPATSTPGASCPKAIASFPPSLRATWTLTGTTNASYMCNFFDYTGGTIVSRAVQYETVAPSPAAYVPATTQDAVAAISANSPTWAEIQALMDLQFPPEVTTPIMTGPAKQFMGNTVELLSPNERKQVEEWKNMDYSTPGEVKVQTEKKTTITSDAKTETTTTVNADGSTSVSTKQIPAQTKTETTFDTDEPAKEDPCKLFPARVGCAEFGEEPETPMPKKTENVTFTPVAFQSNATCPAPLAITGTLPGAGSFNYSLSYAGICNGAAIIRLFLLAGATLVGVGIFVGGLKS